MADKEAHYDEKNTLLSFGWDSGYMQVCLDGLLPTNPHNLNLFSKALNDNIGLTPLGYPSAGRIVLDYMDAAITATEEMVIANKAWFSKAAADAHVKMPDYDNLCESFSGKLTDVLSKHAKPIKQKLTEASRKLKASQKKLTVAQKEKSPSWYIAELQYVISGHDRQIEELQKEYLPWKVMSATHKNIRDNLAKTDQLKRNKEFLTKKLKEV